jgi:hypothetical protein
MVSSRTLRCIRRPTVELAIAGLAAIIGAGCGGDTDVSACILPDPADRRPLRQEAYIKAPAEASKKSVFGVPVALSADGRTLAVGARDDPSGALGVGADAADRSQPGAGAVYIFAHDGSRWAQQAYLKPSNKYALVGFGSALAISRTGDTLIVGVPDDSNAKLRPGGPNAGSAVVFQRAGTTWSRTCAPHVRWGARTSALRWPSRTVGTPRLLVRPMIRAETTRLVKAKSSR